MSFKQRSDKWLYYESRRAKIRETKAMDLVDEVIFSILKDYIYE